MKNVYRLGVSFTLFASLGCLSPNQPSNDELSNDPDGLVAGLGLDGPEALFVQDQVDPVPFVDEPCVGALCVDPADVLVNFVKNQDQLQPSVATRADGVSLVVFTDKSNAVSNPANPSDIKGRFVNSEGVPLEKDFFISATVNGAQDQPDVAVASDGTFLVVWRDSSTNPARIMGRRLTFNGSSADFLTSGELVIQTVVATENLLQPAVASVSLGAEFVVVWTKTTATDGGGIGAKRVDADGTLGASAFGIFNNVGTTQNDPDVIGSGNGNFLVAWTDANVLAASRVDVRGKRFNGSDNSGIGADFTINTGTTGSQHQAALAASDIGETYFAAWNDASDGSGTGIKGKRIVGAVVDALDTAVNNTIANNQAQPAAGFDALNGGFVVAWVDSSQAAPDTSSTSIRGRLVRANGTLFDSDLVLNSTITNGQTQVALASFGGFGEVQAVWADASPSTVVGFDGLGFGVRGRVLLPQLRCGNSIVDAGETCDNGNNQSGDGCDSSCQVEAGFNCVNSVTPSDCDPTAPNNESNTPVEADFCNLQFPFTTTVTSGGTSAAIFGRIFENGVTQTVGPNASITAEAGFGPIASDPRAGGWQFFRAAFNVQVGNDDEYQFNFRAPVVAATTPFSYTYRFSLDGVSYTYCDINGAGSNADLNFESNQLGVMTVNPINP